MKELKDINLIIYHRDCADGFCAAYVAKKKFPQADLLPRSHGEPLPLGEVFGRRVLVVDFSWRTKEDNRALKSLAESFHILDHHKTAQETLKGESYATFDMERSGAGLTWDTLFPGEPRPWYVDYVEDRDLWRFKLPGSGSVRINACVASHFL